MRPDEYKGIRSGSHHLDVPRSQPQRTGFFFGETLAAQAASNDEWRRL